MSIEKKEYTPTATASQVKGILPLFTSYSSSLIGAEKATVSMLDHCRSKRLPYTFFISPNRGSRKHLSTVTSMQFNQFKLAMLKGYPRAERELVMTKAQLAEATELNATVQRDWPSGSAKAKRKTAILADIGSKIGKLGKMLEKNPTNKDKKAANKTKGKRAAQQTIAKETVEANATKVLESLLQAGKRAQADEAPAYDVVALVDLITKAIEVVNTPLEPKH